MGIKNNGQGIETKAEFESRIYNFLLELMLTRKSSDTVLIVGGSDVWKAIRKMEDIKMFCPDINLNQKLECGEFTEFKMVRPTICVQSGKFKQGKENGEINK